MSNYFKTLSRLKRGVSRETPTVTDARSIEDAPLPTADAEWKPTVLDFDPPSDLHAQAVLLDSIRALPLNSSVPSVVIASASRRDFAEPRLEELQTTGAINGLEVLIAELCVTGGRRFLRTMDRHDQSVADARSNQLELSAKKEPLGKKFPEWLERHGTGRDLVVVKGPPLPTAIDAALIAKQCDGILLVYEALATTKQELMLAVERARAAKANVLGLISVNSRDYLPEWLRRLVSPQVGR